MTKQNAKNRLLDQILKSMLENMKNELINAVDYEDLEKLKSLKIQIIELFFDLQDLAFTDLIESIQVEINLLEGKK